MNDKLFGYLFNALLFLIVFSGSVYLLYLSVSKKTILGKPALKRFRIFFGLLGAMLLAFSNLFLCGLLTTYLGGDASSGHIEGGKYFVVNHNIPTEVSQGMYYFSYYYITGSKIVFALLFVSLCLYYIYLIKKGHEAER